MASVSKFDQVKEFYELIGRPTKASLGWHGGLISQSVEERSGFMQEELNEFKEANYDFYKQLDALIDLHYFMIGTLIEMGVTKEQYDAAFSEVHRANMEKKSGNKPGRENLNGDAIKPEGWREPDFKTIFETSV